MSLSALIAKLTIFVAYLAVGCGIYKPTIALLNAVTAGLLATVILYLYYMVLKEERWAWYIGLAFALFTIQYLLQAAASWAETWEPARALFGADSLNLLQRGTHAICSPANNLCFFAAGRDLLKKPKVLPPWIWAFAAFTALSEIAISEKAISQMGPYSFLVRLPDGLFSFVCLLVLGSAMFVNFVPQRRPILATLSFLGAFAYGGLNLAYACTPLVVSRWSNLTKEITTRLALLKEAGLITADVPVLKTLDSLIFAFAFLFKVILFLGVFLLIVKVLLVLSPEANRGLLRKITYGRGRYLAPSGILRALGESTEADLVALCIRLTETREERVAWWRWLRDPFPSAKPLENVPLPSAENSIVAWIMRTGRSEVTCPDLSQDQSLRSRYLEYAPGMNSFVTMPIRYHGAVIACLNLEWKKSQGYSATTVQRVHQMAELLAPTIYERRQLISIDALTDTFRHFKAAPHGAGSIETIRHFLRAVHDALSPLATGCLLILGFRWIWVACNDTLPIDESSGVDSELVKNPEKSVRQMIRRLASPQTSQRTIFKTEDLVVPGHQLAIGKLVFAIAPFSDPPTRPSLTNDYLHRRVIASLLADAILAAVQSELMSTLNRLQLQLNLTAVPSVEDWFSSLLDAVRDAGLPWAAVVLPPHHEVRHLGSDAVLTFIQDLDNRGLLTQSVEAEGLHRFPCTTPVAGARHAILLPLRDSGAQLWLGVSRETFGPELQFASPWRLFLLNLARISDSTLVRIQKQQLQLAAKHLEVISTKVQTARLLVHTLGNDANALLHGIENLEAGLWKLNPQRDMSEELADLRRKVSELQTSRQTFHLLFDKLKQPIPSDKRDTVMLSDATERIQLTYEQIFTRMEIDLRISGKLAAWIDVPLRVAYTALSTLVMNAAEAVHSEKLPGTIRITAYEEKNIPEYIICRVQDTGPGIRDEDVLQKLFKVPTSSKENGDGLGLFLTRHDLEYHRGRLLLETWKKGATSFAIYFPKAEKE